MKVIVTGATGTAGFEAMRTACTHPGVAAVTVVGRRKPAYDHHKLSYVNHADFASWPQTVLDQLRGHAGVLWCMGISPVGISAEDAIRVNCEYPITAARALATLGTLEKPFVFASVSGAAVRWSHNPRWLPLLARMGLRREKELAELDGQMPSLRAISFRAGFLDPGAEPGRIRPFRQRFTQGALEWVWPSFLMTTTDLAKVMLHSIVDDGDQRHRKTL